jgi:hypothetical protein
MIFARTVMHAAWSAQMTSTDAVSALHRLALVAYAFLAMRAVHDESRPRSGAKALVLTVGAQVAMMVVPLLTAIMTTIWTVSPLRNWRTGCSRSTSASSIRPAILAYLYGRRPAPESQAVGRTRRT